MARHLAAGRQQIGHENVRSAHRQLALDTVTIMPRPMAAGVLGMQRRMAVSEPRMASKAAIGVPCRDADEGAAGFGEATIGRYHLTDRLGLHRQHHQFGAHIGAQRIRLGRHADTQLARLFRILVAGGRQPPPLPAQAAPPPASPTAWPGPYFPQPTRTTLIVMVLFPSASRGLVFGKDCLDRMGGAGGKWRASTGPLEHLSMKRRVGF